MGIFGSSEKKIEEKVVDSVGHVNNNIVIQQAKDVHQQAGLNEKMLYTMFFMCAIEVFKLATYLYIKFKKNIKKKYNQQPNNVNHNA